MRPLTPGDLVLRKVVEIARNPAWGKLGPNWEGPYQITLVANIGAYYLEDLDKKVGPHPWNVITYDVIIINDMMFFLFMYGSFMCYCGCNLYCNPFI